MNDPSEPEDADSAKLSSVLIELRSLWARVEGPVDATQALEQVCGIQQREMQEQYLGLLQTRFTWWQVVSSPWHAWRFCRERRRFDVASVAQLKRDDWHRLNRLVTRIEFGLHVDRSSADHLRRFLRARVLTARDAWRLLHSVGCRIEKDCLEPASLPLPVAAVGLVVGIFLGLIALLFAAQVLIDLLGDCQFKECEVLGGSMVCSWLLFIAPSVICWTWGRRDAARVLHALLSSDQVNSFALYQAIKRPFFMKLVW